MTVIAVLRDAGLDQRVERAPQHPVRDAAVEARDDDADRAPVAERRALEDRVAVRDVDLAADVLDAARRREPPRSPLPTRPRASPRTGSPSLAGWSRLVRHGRRLGGSRRRHGLRGRRGRPRLVPRAGAGLSGGIWPSSMSLTRSPSSRRCLGRGRGSSGPGGAAGGRAYPAWSRDSAGSRRGERPRSAPARPRVRPKPSMPVSFFGLFVRMRSVVRPRSARIWLPIP